MKSRRHLSILLLVASVFLFLVSSCGIPTYIVPSRTTITKGTYDEENKKLTFGLTYSAESEDPSSDYVGLLLLFYLGDSTNSASTSINSKFSSQFKKSKYDGDFVTIKENTPVLSYTYSEIEYKIYAFEVGGNVISNPVYTLDIPDNPAVYNITLEYLKDEKKVKMYCSEIPLPEEGIELDFYDDFDVPIETSFIHIYGAMSVQSSNYSNIYWSDLQYCGFIQ